MAKGQKTNHSELKKNGWFKKNGTIDDYEIWINNILASYLYFDPIEEVVKDVFYVQ